MPVFRGPFCWNGISIDINKRVEVQHDSREAFLAVILEMTGEHLAEVEWRESGDPPVAAERHRGFGTELIEKVVAHELRQPVTLDFALSGVRCVLRVPVRRPAKVAVPQPKTLPKPPATPPQPVQVAEPVPAPAAVPASVPTPAAKPVPAAPAPKASSVVLRKPPPAPKPAPVSRLVLDPVVIPVAAPLPGAGVSGATSGAQPDLVTSQAGTDLERLQAQMAQDRQRLNEMEKMITQLRLESAQAQASAAGVGLERPLALSDARHPVWLLAVSGVAALSLLFSGYLLLRLRRQEQARAWWPPSDR